MEPGLVVCLAFEEGSGHYLYHSTISDGDLRESNSITFIGHQPLQEGSLSLWGFQMEDKTILAELNVKARAESNSKLGGHAAAVRRASVWNYSSCKIM